MFVLNAQFQLAVQKTLTRLSSQQAKYTSLRLFSALEHSQLSYIPTFSFPVPCTGPIACWRTPDRQLLLHLPDGCCSGILGIANDVAAKEGRQLHHVLAILHRLALILDEVRNLASLGCLPIVKGMSAVCTDLSRSWPESWGGEVDLNRINLLGVMQQPALTIGSGDLFETQSTCNESSLSVCLEAPPRTALSPESTLQTPHCMIP